MTTLDQHLICIIDDDPSVRDSLGLLLGLKGFDCRTYESAELFLAALPNRPVCVILDLQLSGVDGLQLQQKLVTNGALAQIIFLSAHADVKVIRSAFLNKAVDFLEKPFEIDSLLKSINRAFHNLTVTSHSIEYEKNISLLTPREHEVLNAIAQGASPREVGETLGISPRTVEVHKARIMQKLDVKSFADLLRVVLVK